MLLTELCAVLSNNGLKAELVGKDLHVRGVNTLESAADGEISFLSNPKYSASLETTKASAVIVKETGAVPDRVSAVRCDDPYAGITVAIIALHGYRKHPQWGLSSQATIHPTAIIGKEPNIAGGATIARDVEIGDNCTIYPGCYIADGSRLGDGCVLFPNVVVYDGCILGDRVAIHAGSVIGEDGLGYAPRDGKWIKIPQIGHVVIGDDVELGANCTIDRATLGRTEIGERTKFGNVVVIGHGTKIGPDCIFVGQVGVAGSTNIGRNVTLAGQVGVNGHLTIGDAARVAGQSGVHGDIEAGATVLGSPAFAIGEARRAHVAFRQLPAWAKRLKELEREVERLRERLGEKSHDRSGV